MPISTATAERARRRATAAARHIAAPPDGWVVGVCGGPDPRGRLERAGLPVAYADRHAAVAGSVGRHGSTVAAGRILIDATAPVPGRPDRATPLDGPTTLAARWRDDDPSTLRGLPAIYGAVVHDSTTGRTTLVRDPVGHRTIYHTPPDDEGRVWFADRLSVLRAIRAVGPELDLQSLRDYLIFAYVPGTSTMYAGASEIAPGTTVEISGPAVTSAGRPITRRWWQPVEGTDTTTIDDDARTLRRLLTEAVDGARPPGPVGVYLSGGVDSSAITALLCERDPTDVHTFAIHFGTELPNELVFVDQVVERTRPGTHHEIELTSTELAATLPATMAALDDPIGDPLTVPNLALGRRAAETVGTIFNGEGGDPVFGGPKNQPMLLAALYGAGDRSHDLDELYLRSHQKCYPDLDRLLRPDVTRALLDLDPPTARIAPYLSAGSMTAFINRLFEANTRLKGSDHILTKVANLTGAAGLVGRSPLFDVAVVEAAFAMDPTHKLDVTAEKAVLKAAVADLLPRSVLARPKAGMRVPVQTWFRGPLRREGSKQLLSRRARIAPYLDRATIKEWTRYDGDPGGRYGRKLWLLLSLETWLQAHEAG